MDRIYDDDDGRPRFAGEAHRVRDRVDRVHRVVAGAVAAPAGIPCSRDGERHR